jgi:TonB family protein
MRIETRTGIVALSALVLSGEALAEWRCDCTRIVGSCAATATVAESFVEVTSTAAQCSRVDYFVDGVPLVALVVDGTERQDWLASSDDPSVIVQSCQVCLDNTGEPNPPEFASSLYSDEGVTLMVEVLPTYPPAALADGIEGYVEVSFTVTPDGIVTAPEVTAAEPEGVFEVAALNALSRWRYTRDASGETTPMTDRIEFSLENALLALRPDATAASRAAAASETSSNGCIHEETRYDFGATIDVSLINACAEPLIVYSCAAGTGTYRDRWTCRNPERSGVVLGSSAPAASRAQPAPDELDSLSSVDRLEISRAPNGEYWWLACEVGDARCRGDGREWVRSLDGQVATIDPQARTRARLARSF